MVDLTVNQHDRGERAIPHRAGGLQIGIRLQLRQYVR